MVQLEPGRTLEEHHSLASIPTAGYITVMCIKADHSRGTLTVHHRHALR